MNKNKVILIWTICISPFIFFMVLMCFVKYNTITDKPNIGNDLESDIIYFSDLENPKNNLSTIIYSSDGVILGEYYRENRSKINYNEISPVLIDALISTEDIRFRKHSGIDVRSLFRAVYGLIIGSQSSGGASTITQQLSKMLFTKKPSTGFQRVKQKLKEWVVAIELEKRYSKNEIISMYLNRFDWINQAVGISSASKVYFNTTPIKLNINQSAVLVGMLKNPSLYNPKRNPEGVKNRRNVVLYQMYKNKKINKNEFDSLKTIPIQLDFQKVDHNEGPAPYFREQLREMLKKWCNENKKPNGEYYNLYTDGLIINTTIDSRVQKHAENAVRNHLTEHQKKFYEQWDGVKNAPFPSNFSKKQIDEIIFKGIYRSDRYQKLKSQGKSNDEILRIFNKKVKTKLFSWNGEIDTVISPRDSVIYNKFFIHTGLISMDPNNGHVKAYVGGINHKFFKYDHVLSGRRQVGSTFKPFLYALAIQEGMKPCDKILNTPVIFNSEKWGIGRDWIPKNTTTEFDGLNLPLKFGLANSINIMTAYIMHQYGPKPVVDIARKMGVTSTLQAVPSICLGTFDLSVKEMAAAYSVFVNQGVYNEPIFIKSIADKNGVILEQFYSQTREVLDEKTSAVMVQLLKSVVTGVFNQDVYNRSENGHGTRGTAVSLRGSKYNLKSEIGGKTGTTQNYSDGWFVGITPNLVTAIWNGCDDRSVHFRNYLGYGGSMSLPIFGYMMRYIYDDDEIKDITEQDKFQYNSNYIHRWSQSQMNCNQPDLNPDVDFDKEEF
tara:strand:- start:3892 stop:6219 length:2328 start_codon:yes stop_codon:yes gene_type:complete